MFDLFPKNLTPQEAQIYAPHIGWLIDRHAAKDAHRISNGEAAAIIAEAEADFTKDLDSAADENAAMVAIRHYRSRINHLVTTTDVLGQNDVCDHIQWLSRAAEIATRKLADWLAPPKPDDAGWFILALGKLGAEELNYSSDLDLIVITLHDPEDYKARSKYINLTKQMMKIMATPTADGIGWRIDLRLRPDPGATPIAINRIGALNYYEALGRTWERSAFIRARAIGGNIDAGKQFLQDIKPFIWRRHLDYAVLDDLKVMLRREARPEKWLGYNVKNGIGGIRSIEFFVHAQQLIYGGRDTQLRQNSTQKAIDNLTEAGWLTEAEKITLKAAYLVWRRIEQRLQIIGDAQTHQMPKSEAGFTDFAKFCGFDDPDIFRDNLGNLSNAVIKTTGTLLSQLAPQHGQAADEMNFDSQNEAREQDLKDLGYQSPQNIINTIDGWMAGRISATRSLRARKLLTKILPRIIKQCGKTPKPLTPDDSFATFARLVEKLPAGLQLFSLIESQHNIADMFITIISSAPSLADQISSRPILVDMLMYQDFWMPVDNWPEQEKVFQKTVKSTKSYEEGLRLLRQQCHEWKFRTSVQMLQGAISPQQAANDLTAIADAIIRAALWLAEQETQRRFGTIEGGQFAVIALGRCGAEEMTFASDLDLTFVYEADTEMQSNGKKTVTCNYYFAKLGQELINALSALLGEGRCYNVDMRLRPSGNAGPVAIHIDGFEKYQQNEAWNWEHMALLKSRIIANTGGHKLGGELGARINNIIKNAIKKNRDMGKLQQEVSDMIERLRQGHPPRSPHDLRNISGGIMDIDLLTQMPQLSPKAKNAPIYRQARSAILPLAEMGLLTEIEAKKLLHACENFTNIMQWMRLLSMSAASDQDPENPLPARFQKQFEIKTYKDLDDLITPIANTITKIMKKYLCIDNKIE